MEPDDTTTRRRMFIRGLGTSLLGIGLAGCSIPGGEGEGDQEGGDGGQENGGGEGGED